MRRWQAPVCSAFFCFSLSFLCKERTKEIPNKNRREPFPVCFYRFFRSTGHRIVIPALPMYGSGADVLRASRHTRFRVSLPTFFVKNSVPPVPGFGADVPRASRHTRFRVSLPAFFAKNSVPPLPGFGADVPRASRHTRLRVSLPTFFAKKVGPLR